jgi:predicted MPP superfamily phosphohydrolase
MLSRRQFFRSLGGIGAVSASTAAYGFGEPVLQLRLTQYSLSPRQWPADFPLRIAVIADIHACDPWMSLVTRFIPAREWATVLAGLKAPLGVHAILGNHDYWDDKAVQRVGQGTTVARRALEAVGIPVYENDVQRLTKDGRSFWLAGLGDQLAYLPARRFRQVGHVGVDDLGATLAKVTDDAPVILLAHEPDVARRVPSRVALQLSGHTHGGQVRLLGWSPAVPVKHGMRLAYGHIRTRCDVIVSGGLGCSIMPFRLGVPPEIVLVSLGKAGAAIS